MTAEDREHVIVGEAAINLIFRQEEITVASLVRELDAMSRDEAYGDRKAAIQAAGRWLHDYRQPGSHSLRPATWFAPVASRGAEGNQEEADSADGIVLNSASDGKSS